MASPAIWIFLSLTVVLGGAAAAATGRALARTWRPLWQIGPYMLVLAGFVRFLHYALFDETLLTAIGFAVDVAVALVFAILGFYTTRRRQMKRQYGW